ncbi:MAG TPA: asparagine synthase (glutamine-hydrolyzing) [Acidobacteriota bacterium]|jgi:asparagine synthase (glutamine-hydrolysing)
MCGICGIVNLDPSEPVSPVLVRSMTQMLAHRGPDDAGYFVEDNIGLGHRRLSIIDLSGGKQPIFNEDRSVVVIFNGEIYNYADLTSDLVACGHKFRTRSDTEAIVHSYEQYGDDCVAKLRGMFAFAIWDRKRKRLLLVRDRLGIKPVYFHLGSRFLCFASEIKALLEIPGVPREVDTEALDLYLSLRYVPGPRTMFKDIFKLQPGHHLVLDHTGARTQKYWDIAYSPPCLRLSNQHREEFAHLLDESVRLRLIAEVPLGVFLSGGLDSSAILALMSQARRGERIKTFSVGYQTSNKEEERSNELPYARMAAAKFGAEHHEFTLSPTDCRDFLPQLVWLLDEPLADPTCIPLFFLSQLARKHVTVVLSGEGADEILAGYGIYKRMLQLERLYRHFPSLVTAVAPRLACLTKGEAAHGYLLQAGLPLEARYRGVCRGFRPSLKRKLLGERSPCQSNGQLDDLFFSYFNAVPDASPLDRMLYVESKTWLPDDLLMKADKMTMANALELRVPFLDHKLVEFVSALPVEFKIRHGRGKFLLRETMNGIVPQAIIKRPKKGFPIPTAPWLRRQLRDFTREVLLSEDSACRLYMDPTVLREIVQEHEKESPDRHQEIWVLLVFEFWHKLFIERRINYGARQSQQAAEMNCA